MRTRLLKLLTDHKDQLAIAPELIVDQLMERYSENDALDDVANCNDEYWWHRYGLPYLMPMTVKFFARG